MSAGGPAFFDLDRAAAVPLRLVLMHVEPRANDLLWLQSRVVVPEHER